MHGQNILEKFRIISEPKSDNQKVIKYLKNHIFEKFTRFLLIVETIPWFILYSL
jgi:hypothetical protein